MTLMILSYTFTEPDGTEHSRVGVSVGDTIDRMDHFTAGEMALCALADATQGGLDANWSEATFQNRMPSLAEIEALGYKFTRLDGEGYHGEDDEVDYLAREAKEGVDAIA